MESKLYMMLGIGTAVMPVAESGPEVLGHSNGSAQINQQFSSKHFQTLSKQRVGAGSRVTLLWSLKAGDILQSQSTKKSEPCVRVVSENKWKEKGDIAQCFSVLTFLNICHLLG